MRYTEPGHPWID